MPTHHQRLADMPTYHPVTQRRKRDRAREILLKSLTLKDLLIAIIAMVIALGWTITSPAKRIGELDTRVTRNEHRLDTLAEQQRFTNYMLCVNARRTDPASVPPDCAPIIEYRRVK